MGVSSNFALINFVIVLLFMVGIVWLQYFLSKKKNKWFGFILPFINILFSTIPVLGMIMFQTLKKSGTIANGIVTENIAKADTNTLALIFTSLYIFVLYNIPTIILLVIYFSCRAKQKKNKEIEKMNILDLD